MAQIELPNDVDRPNDEQDDRTPERKITDLEFEVAALTNEAVMLRARQGELEVELRAALASAAAAFKAATVAIERVARVQPILDALRAWDSPERDVKATVLLATAFREFVSEEARIMLEQFEAAS